MPFTSYTSITDVAVAHRIQIVRNAFLRPVATSISDYFRSELAFTLNELAFDGSEYAACESLIFPLLREVWKPFHRNLTLWSHQSISYNEDLCGTPDYIIARRSPLGVIIFDLPYLLVVEAKKDDFPRGWGQCLAALRAVQKLNNLPNQTLYGVATNGRGWEFGRLQGDVFTQDPRTLSLFDLDSLTAALQSVFLECRDQAAQTPPSVVA